MPKPHYASEYCVGVRMRVRCDYMIFLLCLWPMCMRIYGFWFGIRHQTQCSASFKRFPLRIANWIVCTCALSQCMWTDSIYTVNIPNKNYRNLWIFTIFSTFTPLIIINMGAAKACARTRRFNVDSFNVCAVDCVICVCEKTNITRCKGCGACCCLKHFMRFCSRRRHRPRTY